MNAVEPIPFGPREETEYRMFRDGAGCLLVMGDHVAKSGGLQEIVEPGGRRLKPFGHLPSLSNLTALEEGLLGLDAGEPRRVMMDWRGVVNGELQGCGEMPGSLPQGPAPL